eukprot:CAMPEP_0180294950 /NCGR_PEP_ID=MMETSP0988-20121125/18629_1 /TAXON_ID=697907 /ORGANISM="non described non described, Strain CCMP2293" /LENGTH=203 /DNA_ID=CAMNT_0022272277 /DNA_START=442 /DNA_END=1051 /DNA_ORIENTATION=-
MDVLSCELEERNCLGRSVPASQGDVGTDAGDQQHLLGSWRMDEEADFVEVFRAVRVDALRGPEYRVRPPPLVAEVERLRNHVERRSFELGEILGRDFCGERREHRRHHELPRHLGALVDDKRADNGFDAVCRQPQEPPLVGREALEAAFRSHPPVRVHSLMHLEVRHSADDERSDSPLRDSGRRLFSSMALRSESSFTSALPG